MYDIQSEIDAAESAQYIRQQKALAAAAARTPAPSYAYAPPQSEYAPPPPEYVPSAPVAPMYSPTTDPAYLAFLRAQGLNESDIQGTIAQRTDTLNRSLQRKLPQIDTQEGIDLRRTASDWENRGLSLSGGRLQAQQEVSNEALRQRNEAIATARGAAADLDLQGAQSVARSKVNTAEQEMYVRGTLGP